MTKWVVGGGGDEGRFSRHPIPVFSARALESSCAIGGDVHSLMLSIQHFLCDHGVAHPPRCPEGWFWRGCRGVWHAQTMQVFVSCQLPEEVPVDLQGSWSCSAPRRWSSAPSRRYGEVSSAVNTKLQNAVSVIINVFSRCVVGTLFLWLIWKNGTAGYQLCILLFSSAMS